MRLMCQVLCIALISSLLCITSSFAADENLDIPAESEPSEDTQVSAEDDEYEDGSGEESETEPPFEFDDFVDLDALAKGVLGPESKQDFVVPCFGTWWPSTGGYGGYVYYYDDYGSNYGDGGGGADDGGDYGRRRRNRKRRRSRRMRNRSRRRSRTTAKKSAKKKT